MRRQRGLTIIELIFIGAMLALASVIFVTQGKNLETVNNDDRAKAAINAMYYSLEEVFYPANQYYPQTISSVNLKSVDPTLFIDSGGNKLGSANSLYVYLPTNCTGGKCKSYTLKATLSSEADYVKTSRNN